ncbi:MAG: HEAT repeat domain-containing protein [Candidatus Omnitrophica bacterium]|nr:HEAT repeat domain-containing protein [Candidatus Omnitrophota bacterium]
MMKDTLNLAAVSAAGGSDQEAKLLGVLKSNASSLKEKCDACRELSIIAGKDSIDTLASLLDNDKLAHMARYGMETIPDPGVDDAFRAALDKLTGLRLAGVIGSIGVRRDAKAIKPLTKLLSSTDNVVAQAAARALGSIGTVEAAEAIQRAIKKTPKANQLAFCEGLFRCAENLVKQNFQAEAVKIYNQILKMDAPHQVRAGALRGVVLNSGREGYQVLMDAIRGDDYAMTAAAARIAQEMPGRLNRMMRSELANLSEDKQTLFKQALNME